MFSSRLDWTANPNPLTRALHAKKAAGVPVLDLTESNPTNAGFSYCTDQILTALGDSRSMRYQPSPAGLVEARAAVAEYYGGRVEIDRILLTASTSEAYGFLFKLLADSGDEVLVPRPSYPLFDFLAALDSVRAIQYPLVYDGRWTIDFAALTAKITSRTRAVLIVNPNNPTGSFLKQSELAELVSICRDHGLAILSDEVFSDYAFEDQPSRIRSLVDVHDVLVFSLNGLSKICALPQMKLGWIVISGPRDLRKQAFDRLELIADTYLSVSAPIQWAASSLLRSRTQIQPQILARVKGNLGLLRDRIGGDSPWRALEVEGGWYAVVQAPRLYTEEEWALNLLEHCNVLVQPGYFFDFEREAFFVLSLLTPAGAFAEGVRRMLEIR